MTDVHKLLADARNHLAEKRLTQAETTTRAAFRLSPNTAEVHDTLGLILRHRGQATQAIDAFRRAIDLDPNFVEAIVHLGQAYKQLGRLDDAAYGFLRAIEIKPDFAQAHFQLGLLFQLRYQYEDAIACYRRCLQINSRDSLSYANLGIAQLMQGLLAEATENLRVAIALNPEEIHALDGLGVLANATGDIDKAMAFFDQALAIDAHFEPARYNRAMTLMRRAEFGLGLPDFDARWRLPAGSARQQSRPFQQQVWNGEPLHGKHLLVWGEQGIGDEIRAASLILDLADRGEKIIIECEPRLTALFQRSFPAAEVVARSETPDLALQNKSIRYQIPGEGLVRILRPGLSDYPARTSFLKSDAARTSFYREIFRKSAKPVVGISWSSANRQLQQGKSSSLMDWASIVKLTGLQFVDLQYGDTTAERAAIEKKHSAAIAHLPDLDLTQDIDGLAALISACDLVITVSNTTAHLAGALGVPAWVILPFGHFQPWYWFTERSDSPWYPSVKLYRQRTFGDWPNVLKIVASDLKSWRPKPRQN
jgi:tetratricopeptide (TPR) repeat protein